jgi:hypothetical protein
MIDRIFKNWKTSLLALILILSAITSVYMKLSTWTEVGAFLGLSMALFFAKDPK